MLAKEAVPAAPELLQRAGTPQSIEVPDPAAPIHQVEVTLGAM